MMTKGELKKAATMWRQAHFGVVMSGSLQLSHTNPSKTGMEEEVSHSSHGSDPVEVQKFRLDDVKGPVCTNQKVTIPPFGTFSVHTHGTDTRSPAAVVLTMTYGEVHPESSRVPLCLHNLSAHTIEIPTMVMVGQVIPAN